MTKIAVITGATSGIGRQAAHVLAHRGYQLVIPRRNREKGLALESSIQKHVPGAVLDLIPCDFNDLNSVQTCGETITARYPAIDLLINNAGIAEMEQAASQQGVERTFAVNHLAHFVLTAWLKPCLKAGARIINTSSQGNYKARADFLDDINFERHKYSVLDAYRNSKLANVLFTLKLAGLLEERGVTCNCLHPGRISTNIWPQHNLYYRSLTGLLKKFHLKSPKQGAKPLLKLALDPALENTTGTFYFEMEPRDPNPLALDGALQDRLWRRSIQLAWSFLPSSFDIAGELAHD